MRTWVAAAFASFTLLGCAAAPPTHFAAGGAGVDIAPGKWPRQAGDVVIGADGVVTVGGEREFTFDKSGRVHDWDGRPYALVEQGGRVVGPDDKFLGMLHGSQIESPTNGLGVTLAPSGELTIKTAQGARTGGVVAGDCLRSPSAQAFCTLVAYLVVVDDLNRQARVQEQSLRRVNRVRQ